MTHDIDQQERYVRWAYIVQWTALAFPPTIVLSLAYLLTFRNRVMQSELRSHMNWQLATCIVILALIPVALVLLMVAMSGFKDDAPLSIIAAFVLMGLTSIFLPWFLYRLLFGTMRFAGERPMTRLWP